MVVSKSKLFTYIEALFAVVIWGASFVASKVALQELAPTTLVWLRFLMGVVVLGIAVILRRQFTLPAKKEWVYFAALGFLGITFHQWLQSNALQTSEAGTSAWIVSTSPVFMAVLGWVFLRESLDWAKTLGILLAFAGVLVVVSKGNFDALALDKFGAPGDKLMLISAVSWAVFSALSRRGLMLHPASLMMFYVMVFGWLFTSIVFLPTQGFLEIGQLTAKGWMGVAFLGIFCSGLAYIAWYDALQVLTTVQTGAFLYIEPLIAVGIAFFVLEEAIVPAALLGGVIILLGVWLVNRR